MALPFRTIASLIGGKDTRCEAFHRLRVEYSQQAEEKIGAAQRTLMPGSPGTGAAKND